MTIITLYTTLHSYSGTLHNINVITQNTILALCEALTLKLICTTNPPNHKETIHTTRYVKEKFTLDELEFACQPNNAGECSFLWVHAPLEITPVSEPVSLSQKSLKQHHKLEIAGYGPVWSRMIPYGSLWSPLVPDGLLLSCLVLHGAT